MMNPLLSTGEYSEVAEKTGIRRNAKKTNVKVRPMTKQECDTKSPAQGGMKRKGKKRKLEIHAAHANGNGAPNKKLEVNPLLGTAEYGSIGEESRQRNIKTKGSNVVNPFVTMPEYEGDSVNGETISKKMKKEKLNVRRLNDPVLKEKNGSLSTGHYGNPQGASKFSKNKNQSRCLHTYSAAEILGKKPKRNGDRAGLAKNKFGPRKKIALQTSQGVGDFTKKKKMPNHLSKTRESDRPSAKNTTKSKNASANQQNGPVTWGLPSSSWGTSECLSLDEIGGFNWNATAQDFAQIVSRNSRIDEEEPEDSDDEVVVKGKKLTPAEKRAKALEEEKNMKKKEKELIEAEDNPQSPDHFERLLIGSPNSAELWIKYMGYHAVNADIEKARAVAQRAIKRIDPQLTSAKLDVWIAFLNLDFTFSPPDVFRETFMEAIKRNDDYTINSRVLNLYAEAKNVSEVDQLANIMVRKYKEKLDNWLQCQNALMMVGLPDKARYILHKALTVLNKKEHVTLISRFALLENKYGFSEQADALFENLLTSFPQRVDLLNVYVDMLVKSSRIDLARSVLERASNNHLPVRKMKTIYTKWLAFEQAHGMPSDAAKVEEAAQRFVSRVVKRHLPSKDSNSVPQTEERSASSLVEGSGSSGEEDLEGYESDSSD